MAKAGYGRQLSRLLGAVDELIKERPTALGQKQALVDVELLVGGRECSET